MTLIDKLLMLAAGIMFYVWVVATPGDQVFVASIAGGLIGWSGIGLYLELFVLRR